MMTTEGGSDTSSFETREFDVTVFGASGFTGRRILQELLWLNHEDNRAARRQLSQPQAASGGEREVREERMEASWRRMKVLLLAGWLAGLPTSDWLLVGVTQQACHCACHSLTSLQCPQFLTVSRICCHGHCGRSGNEPRKCCSSVQVILVNSTCDNQMTE